MDDNMLEFLEKSLHEEIFIYNELLDCFKMEKEALVNIDLESLWNISKEKNELCAKINSIEQKIFSAVRSELDKQHFPGLEKAADFNRWSQLHALITDVMQEKDRPKFRKLYYSLQSLKREIDAMRKVNTDTVEHSLQFLDEIISIITGQAHQEVMYNDRCRYTHSRNNMLMSREV